MSKISLADGVLECAFSSQLRCLLRLGGNGRRYHRRMNTAADQAAASLVGYAQRRKFAAIAYDDTERGFCPEFVWFRLEQRIKSLCDERGVEFTTANGVVLAEYRGSLEPL